MVELIVGEREREREKERERDLPAWREGAVEAGGIVRGCWELRQPNNNHFLNFPLRFVFRTGLSVTTRVMSQTLIIFAIFILI